MSHELRTPLNALLGWSDMLLKGAVDPERVRHIAEILKRNAEVQHRLVEDMLDLSTFVSGRMRMAAESVLIGESVQAACEVVKPAADAKHVRLIAAVPPMRVIGDKMRLQQVFWNLLTNAVKFTPVGGSVDVDARVLGEEAIVSVRDTGVGIAPEDQERIFEAFQRGDRRASVEGTGLGLTLSKRFVELHGGRVWLESALGEGSTFGFAIPVGPR